LERKISNLDKKIKLAWLLSILTVYAAIFIIGSVFYTIAPPDSGMFGIDKGFFPIMFFLLMAVLFIPAYYLVQMTYSKSTYEFTERELIIKDGLISRKLTSVPYAKVVDAKTDQTPVEMILGLYTIDIDVANSPTSKSKVKLQGISDKDAFISELMSFVQQSKAAPSGSAIAGKPTMEQMMAEVLKELKAVSSKVENLSAKIDSGKPTSKKERTEAFSSMGFDEDFKRFKKK
jgi:membrane protein YdbS with pleckstrin-like domain